MSLLNRLNLFRKKPAASQLGDQTLVGPYVIDPVFQSTTFKIYREVANPNYPDKATRPTIYQQVGSEYPSRDAAIAAAKVL